ncbi:uncharacterized protein LOC129246358 [Anastrepha obliqua]|uniref:uncharacterized protein LOC129246358 n=1 Tax=Anastrepha obliqua TaxID=95512 RepID=UPI00240A8FE7|nr:uncharacterized protein LOC129246358 [Anastrepha obliqua]
MSTSAGLLANVIPAIALTQDTTLAAPQRNNFSSSVTPTATNCEFISTQVSSATELSCRISRSSSQQNFETDSGKSSCSPAILDCSFDSGIGGVVANVATGGGATVGGGSDDCAVIDEQIVGATNLTVPRICGDGGASDSFGVVTVTGLGIGTGISCNAEEQMRLKLRYERLQQWRIILLALDRQKDPYRLLRERLSKIGERRISRKRPTNDSICYVCSCQIEQNDSNSFATCYLCNKRICRGAKCSNWLPKSGRWECHLCHSSNDSLTHTQSWVAEQMCFNRQKYVYPMRARSEIYIPIGDFNEGPLHFESVSQVGLNSDAITAEQKLKIREYVEEVVAKLLGGSLDQIRVSQLSKSENYLHLFEQYHSKLSNIFINLENELSNKALNGDLPGIVNSHVVPQSTLNLNNDQSNNNSNVHMPSELPELSQTRLRQMIESIIAETLRMPPLANGSVSEIALNKDNRCNGSENNLLLENGNMRLRHRHRTEHYFEPKIYQDLLATAVLNKIADKEGNIRQFSESTPDLSSCNIDRNFNVENRSTSSGSSVEPRSDFSYTDTEQVPKVSFSLTQFLVLDAGRESALSDYIAAHTVPLPDLSAAVTESEEEDHASISSSILAEGTWEDNWLFKKKRSSLTASMTGSVGMLVPAPKDDVRAQIGDKTTDEISDLSEMGSDTDDSSLKIVRTNLDPLNDRILNKHLIGGQNTKVVLDELIETASLISNTTQSVDEPKYAETRNKYVVEAASKIKAINPNVTKHSAQEGETILDNPETEREQNSLSDQLSSDSNRTDESTSTTIESFLADFNNEQDMPLTNISNNTSADTTELTNGSYLSLSPSYSKFNINQEQHFINNNNNHQQDFNREDDDVVHLRYFVPGSIAEREYKKWNNAVEMPNNPYAPEALKRRISGSQERFMDLPNISQSTNKNPISLIKTTKSEALAENESRSDIDYKRYSRDYYINDDKVLKTSPKHQIITTDSNCPSLNISDEPTADIAINEVNCHSKNSNKSSPIYNDHSDCHWTLSTPVRRSSSLKFINRRSPPQSYYKLTTKTTSTTSTYNQAHLPPRSFTSASHYDNLDRIHFQDYCDNDSSKYSNCYRNTNRYSKYEDTNEDGNLHADNYSDIDDYNNDIRSQRSWRSASAAANYPATLPKRHTVSSLSFHSSASGVSLNSSGSKNRALPSANILSQFEKQLLHKDLKRNSFRAVSATTKDFVMNPLYERDNLNGVAASSENVPNGNRTSDEHIDSGVDSCLNGFNETDVKANNTSLLFSLSEKNETHAIENPIEPHPAVYQALPAQVVEENTSIETLSNQSMQSVNTTTSDDSDTVRIYNFKEQKTIVVRNGDKASTTVTTKLTPETSSEPTLQVTVPLSPTLEDAPRCPISEQAAECEPRQPTESTLEANINSSSVTVNRTPITPTRGSTPMAFKFLQPKRKLIDPSQVLSLDEGADALSIFSANEKAVVEEEVAQVMPSVKALAQAFILSSSKYTIAEKRWKKGVQNMPSVPSKPIFKQEAMQKTEASTSIAEIAEDATIASDLSSLETDPPTNKDLVTVKPTDDLSPITPSPTNSPTSDLAAKVEGNKSATNALRRISMLKSNIAFFENLRFK